METNLPFTFTELKNIIRSVLTNEETLYDLAIDIPSLSEDIARKIFDEASPSETPKDWSFFNG